MEVKYLVIIYIAIGFVLSSAIGIEYTCDGKEMFPEYTGSPFVFRQKSLGSSMTYYYSISGLVINTALWTVLLMLLRRAVLNAIGRIGSCSSLTGAYKVVVVALILFTTLNIWVGYITLGRGFGEALNYWYFDLAREAHAWGADCEGRWGVFLILK